MGGNLNGSDRVDIAAEARWTGDGIAQRIAIEDGAFFKGSIDSPDKQVPLRACQSRTCHRVHEPSFVIVSPKLIFVFL